MSEAPEFIKPMLASPYTGQILEPETWFAEEKLDGHRIMIRRDANGYIAWSRLLKPRTIVPPLHDFLLALPHGVYDGELLVPGGKSYVVKTHARSDELLYVIFYCLELMGKNLLEYDYQLRRLSLDAHLAGWNEEYPVRRSKPRYVADQDAVQVVAAHVAFLAPELRFDLVASLKRPFQRRSRVRGRADSSAALADKRLN